MKIYCWTPLISLLLALPLSAIPEVAKNKVGPAVLPEIQYFDLADVTLGSGPFRDAMLRDKDYLLRLSPDRLLHTFFLNVGLPSDAKPYGGWEGPDVELRGHTMGHYLTACSLMYRSDRDPEMKRRVDYLVTQLARCQTASPEAGYHEGYLSAYPESFFDRLEGGKEWVWAPYYTLHKIMAGLLDAYRLTGNTQTLKVLEGMAKWVQFRVDRLSHDQMQAILETEFGGMNEMFANLYAATGNPDHLRMAKAFDHEAIYAPLAKHEDEMNGLHANTQIPKIIGAIREYEFTGRDRYREIADYFWDRIALHRSYVIGGNSDREHLFPTDSFWDHLSAETAETCNTYNMLRLTRDLFALNPEAQKMDFYERALYNHILASQEPTQGMFVYLMSLKSGHFKGYSTPENSFWCCVGTGMENHSKYGDTIFAHSTDGLYVNLYISAEVNWKDRGIVLSQESNLLENSTTRLTVEVREPIRFGLHLRHPSWAKGALKISVNGGPLDLQSTPGTYLTIDRVWNPGDVVEIEFPTDLHYEMLPGTDNLVALLYGPIVLAGQLGSDGMPRPFTEFQLAQARFPDPVAPVWVNDDGNWLDHVKMVSRNPLVFKTQDLSKPAEVQLIPFYRQHDERNAVYWELLTSDQWQDRQKQIAQIEEEISDYGQSAIDRVIAGDENSESAHQYEGSMTDAGIVSGRSWRQAHQEGYFSYIMDAHGQKELALVCVFGSKDQKRTFDILVDDEVLATPELDGKQPGLVFCKVYSIPESILKDKEQIRISFKSADNWDTVTANVFECMLVPFSESAE